MNIVITEFMDDAAVEGLRKSFDVVYDPNLVDQPDRLAELAKGAEALIVRNRTQVRGPLLEGAVALKCVGRLGVGLDNIDSEACADRGITVFPATGANDDAVAEYVITSVLMLLRGAYSASSEVAASTWPRQHLIGREVGGKTLGLIGFGSIARETARRAQALGMDVITFDPYISGQSEIWAQTGVKNVPLDAVLERSDAISLHVPLTKGTRHIINRAALKKMRPTGVLINAARGGVVDEEALVAALKAGELAGAALDVFENEPLSAEAGQKFAGLTNVVLTPHIAGVTKEANVRVSHLIAKLVSEHLQS